MTPDQIKALRNTLGESTDDFGKRFARSGRTVEDWEQGRRNPDPLILSMLAQISPKKKVKKSRRNSDKAS